MTTTRDPRAALVFAPAHVIDAARPVIGEQTCLEQHVARAIARGQVSATPRENEPRLRRGERLVRPFDCSWVAVVTRGPGRLVRDRQPQAWHVVRVCEVR
jgi:hypothetical protein